MISFDIVDSAELMKVFGFWAKLPVTVFSARAWTVELVSLGSGMPYLE